MTGYHASSRGGCLGHLGHGVEKWNLDTWLVPDLGKFSSLYWPEDLGMGRVCNVTLWYRGRAWVGKNERNNCIYGSFHRFALVIREE